MEDAIDFYEMQVVGLGQKFRSEIGKAAKRIAEYPLAWSIERGEVRRYVLHKFPYKLLYSIETDHILILAIAHQHRHPEYWIDRS